jgi:chemotaxis protein CheC
MDYLTCEQLDALQEIVNIGIGRAAAMLNEMVDTSFYHRGIKMNFPFIVRFNWYP